MNKAALLGIDGIRPVATSDNTGLAMIITIKKEIPMMAINAMMNASIFRMPNRCSSRNKNVSNTVIDTPQINGRPVNNCIPIAIPKISARSVAAIANSANP